MVEAGSGRGARSSLAGGVSGFVLLAGSALPASSSAYSTVAELVVCFDVSLAGCGRSSWWSSLPGDVLIVFSIVALLVYGAFSILIHFTLWLLLFFTQVTVLINGCICIELRSAAFPACVAGTVPTHILAQTRYARVRTGAV